MEMVVANRELGSTLRAWRDRIPPEEWGLLAGKRRRAPGLRRQEVARLAGVSVDYIVQLEQGRAADPSKQVLLALARALRLSEVERVHLFLLAGRPAPKTPTLATVLPDSVRRLIDQLQACPAAVYDPLWNPVAWNRLWTVVMGDPSARPERERNLVWREFTGLSTRVARSPAQRAAYERLLVADLHTNSARYPDDHEFAKFVGELSAASARFRELWDSRPVDVYDGETKTVRHPELGILQWDCDILSVQRSDLRVVVYTARLGSEKVAENFPSGGLTSVDIS